MVRFGTIYVSVVLLIADNVTGVGLSTSPLGLAAYVLEKFSTATNKGYRALGDGGLTKKLKMDDLLTNLMIYWTTNSMTSAARFYKENIKFNEMEAIMER